jgi:GNAT superfamily N-acetyltransferase
VDQPRLAHQQVKLAFQPLTPARWRDLEQLFGARGACGGCWCMTWRQTRSEFDANKGEKNRRAFQKIVRSGAQPGVLAYDGDQPIGWCAIAPREQYVVLQRARTLKPIDDQPVWSVTCFFVTRPYRRRGISVQLLNAAVDFARRRGAEIVEGYPVVATTGKLPDAFAWTGLPETFLKAGFKEVARPAKTRPIMRREVSARARASARPAR